MAGECRCGRCPKSDSAEATWPCVSLPYVTHDLCNGISSDAISCSSIFELLNPPFDTAGSYLVEPGSCYGTIKARSTSTRSASPQQTRLGWKGFLRQQPNESRPKVLRVQKTFGAEPAVNTQSYMASQLLPLGTSNVLEREL